MNDTVANDHQAAAHEAPKIELKSSNLQTLTYMPIPGDPEETNVGSVQFKAYEAVELEEHHGHIAAMLESNPWFTSGEIDAERKEKWDTVKEARAKADAAKQEIEEIEKKHK